MKHKLFAIVISLALIVTMALPGTLAIAADQDSSTGEIAPAVEAPDTEENPVENTDSASVIAPVECSCGTEIENHAEDCPLYVTPVSDDTQAECTCRTENDVHGEACPLYVAPAPADPVKECTCGTETEVHTEDCPLYVKAEEVSSVTVGMPSDAEKLEGETSIPKCACDPKPAEGEAHKENCPLYVAQMAESSLFERLMVCETLEELFAIVDETPQEELLALTEEENAQLEVKIAELEPEPLPPVVVEETNDVPVVSEIIYPTVNFDNVAPFGAPVEG